MFSDKEFYIPVFIVIGFLIFGFFFLPYLNKCGGLHFEFKPYEERSKCGKYKMVYGCVGDEFNGEFELIESMKSRTHCGYWTAQDYENSLILTAAINENKRQIVLFFCILGIMTIAFLTA